ncbi:hypothetical protein ES695_03215 [Candidatus Atribacteria bacterium 1244-E10-H5-B2]|nr:MAG: hypothetical protein ES695_03215 [Candidatus Atribacteria bacterium 1244-E10-H5-B2]
MKTYELKLMPTLQLTEEQKKDLLKLGFKREHAIGLTIGVWTYCSNDIEDTELTVNAIERGREIGIIDAEFKEVNWTLAARKKQT